VTTRLDVEHWYENLGAATLADAILDRLVHKAHRITLHGESLRKQKSLTKKGKQLDRNSLKTLIRMAS
jgi:DNA replication protein DnaC